MIKLKEYFKFHSLFFQVKIVINSKVAQKKEDKGVEFRNLANPQTTENKILSII